MNYGICNLSVVAVRKYDEHESEQINQLLFGEHFIIQNQIGEWIEIENPFDNSKGWINSSQCTYINKEEYDAICKRDIFIAKDYIDFVFDNENNLIPISVGSNLPHFSHKLLKINNQSYKYEGEVVRFAQKDKSELVNNAYAYLNSPFLWGGKSPMGIDASGFTQMVYKLNGIKIPRRADEQAKLGDVLSFIEESEPGDLAFFDNEEGEIVHVGIILSDNYIIHSHGKVRIDMIDHSGIYNLDTKRHSHKLRVIKKIC